MYHAQLYSEDIYGMIACQVYAGLVEHTIVVQLVAEESTNQNAGQASCLNSKPPTLPNRNADTVDSKERQHSAVALSKEMQFRQMQESTIKLRHCSCDFLPGRPMIVYSTPNSARPPLRGRLVSQKTSRIWLALIGHA